MKTHNRRLDIALALGLAAFVLLPWYRIDGGFFGFGCFGSFRKIGPQRRVSFR